MMTLAVPPSLPLAFWLVGHVRPEESGAETAIWVAAGVYLWALAVMVGLSF